MSDTSTPPASIMSDTDAAAVRRDSSANSPDGGLSYLGFTGLSDSDDPYAPAAGQQPAGRRGSVPVRIPGDGGGAAGRPPRGTGLLLPLPSGHRGSAGSGSGGGGGGLSRAVRSDEVVTSVDSDTSVGAAAELKLRGVAEPKLLGGAEPSADAGDSVSERQSSPAAKAAAEAGQEAEADAQQAAEAITGEARSADGSGSSSGGSNPTAGNQQRPPQDLDSAHSTGPEGEHWVAAAAAAADQPAPAAPDADRQHSRSGSFLTDSVLAAEASAVAEAASADGSRDGASGEAAKAAPLDEVAAAHSAEPAAAPATAAPAAAAPGDTPRQEAAAADSGSDGEALGGLFDEPANGDAAAGAATGTTPGAGTSSDDGWGLNNRTGLNLYSS